MSNPLKIPMIPRSLRNLVSKPVTRRYPDEVRVPFAGTRGAVEFDFDNCILCGLCVRRCPTAALSCSREEGWFAIDHLSCVACGACVDACNKDGFRMSTSAQPVYVRAKMGIGGGRPGREEWHRTESQTPPIRVSDTHPLVPSKSI